MIETVNAIHSRLKSAGKPWRSAEFFPPKSEDAVSTLVEHTAPMLLANGIDFFSVTYGARGLGNKQATLNMVSKIQNTHAKAAVMHLTTDNTSVAEMRGLVRSAAQAGVVNFLALRGDGSKTGKERLVYASDLLELIRSEVPTACIGVAGFPNGNHAIHESRYSNWRFLCDKVRCGADFITTQLFFNNDDFWEMRDFVTGELGREVPIAAGIMPFTSLQQAERFVTLTGVALPRTVTDAMRRFGDDRQAVANFGFDYVLKQSQGLVDGGVSGLHYYCLNRTEPVVKILTNLRI